ncbi:MAG: alpha/beta fold hydrolase [Myxococcota bacterium]
MTAVEALGRRVLLAAGYRSRHVDSDVGRVHVWTAEGGGDLPPLVLFHGLGASAMHWAPMLQALRPRVSAVVAMDLPGHGLSDRVPELTLDGLRAGVDAAMDAVAHAPAVVVGNSLGGAVAVRWVLSRPERVRGAVLFSPAGAPMSAEELAGVQEVFRIEGHADAVRFVRQLHGRPVGLRAHFLAPLLRRSLADPVLQAWLHRVSDADFLAPAELAGLPVPVRVVGGLQERILPLAGRDFWRAHLPAGSEVVEPDGFGHSPFLDDRAWTARQVLDFAARVA